MIKDRLTSEVAGIILRYAKSYKGLLTLVSDESRINRREFNIRGLSQMKLHRLLRILYVLGLELRGEDFQKMMDEIRDTITDYVDQYDFTLLDE